MPDSKPEAVSATSLIDARIDARIVSLQDWRGPRLASLRRWIKAAEPEVIEEWKWRGVPVWSHGGIICTVETARPSAVHWQRAQSGGDAELLGFGQPEAQLLGGYLQQLAGGAQAAQAQIRQAARAQHQRNSANGVAGKAAVTVGVSASSALRLRPGGRVSPFRPARAQRRPSRKRGRSLSARSSVSQAVSTPAPA